MLEHLVEAVILGQPESIVVAHTTRYAAELLTQVANALEAAGLKVFRQGYLKLVCEGSVIRFTIPALIQPDMLKNRPGLFYDNSVEDV